MTESTRAKVARALAARDDRPLARLVAGEADGLQDLVVDRYGQVARIETSSAEAARAVDDVCAALVARGIDAIVHVTRGARGKGGVRVLFGDVPSAHVVDEDGFRFLVRTKDDEALGTGIFVDQRRGRALVRAHALGHPMLNLFAHAGGFTVAAARGGASRVDHVDMSKKCARWGALNLALNGVNPRAHRFVVDDAIDFVARAARRARDGGERYRVIVCDPPTTAVRPDGTRMVARDLLAALAASCLAALDDQGLLVLSCNDRALTDDDLVDVVLHEDARAHVSPLPFDADVAPDGARGSVSTRAVVVRRGAPLNARGGRAPSRGGSR